MRIWRNGLIVILLFAAPVLSIKSQTLYPPDIQRILARGKLLVAVYKNDIPPLFYHDRDGVLVGHEIFLAKEIATALGVGIEFNRQASSFDEIIDVVIAGKVDMGISLVSRTMNRVKRARFSRPYLVIHPVLLVNRIFLSGSDASGLLGKLSEKAFNVSEKKGTAYVDMATTLFPKARVNEKNEWDDVIREVAEGTADVALRDEIGVTNLVRSNPELGISIHLIPLEKINDNICVVLAPGSVQLEHWINIFLEQNGYPIGSKELFSRFGEK
jgi:ABC-type amino acid transport substrate-binding protein